VSTADRLREISRNLQIHKKLEKEEMLTALATLIDMAERLERLETVYLGRKC
jgi:hypothetical protein